MEKLHHEIPVRGYELDADGHLPPHLWLRYMEYLRWLAVERGSADLVEQFRAGGNFVVVAQALRIEHEVGFGTTLDGAIWVARVGTTSVDMWHSFHSGGELAAVGRVTAVYIEHGKPSPVPEVLHRVEPNPPVTGVAFAEPMRDSAPEDAFEHSLCVRPADLDLLRHANHSSYSVFVDAARRAAAAANAYGDASEVAAGRITGMNIEYLAQSLLGEQLTMRTWVDQSAPLHLGFELTRDGTVLTRARVLIR